MKTEAVPSNTTNKIWCFEWLRVAACMAVVLIHCFATVLDNFPVYEVGVSRALGWTETLIFLARWAVPIFLMITGALLLNPDKHIGYKKALGYAWRMAAVLLTFGYCFALVELVFMYRTFTLSMLWEAFLNVLQERSWNHLWYLYDLLGIYLLLPVVKAFVNSASKRELETLLVILFCFTSVVLTVDWALGWSIKNIVWFSASFFYFVLGHYLYAYVEINARLAILSIVAVVTMASITAYHILMLGDYAQWAWDPGSALIAPWAAGIFLCAKKFANAPIKNRLVQSVATLSFGIYVVHPVFTNALYKVFNWLWAPLPPVLYEVATFLIVFVAAYVTAWLLKRVPGVRNIL